MPRSLSNLPFASSSPSPASFLPNNTNSGERFTVGTASQNSFTGLNSTKQENMLLFVGSEAIESKPVTLETN